MMKLGGVQPTGRLSRWGHRCKVSQVGCGLVLVEFQDRYNTCRWGGLYTITKHWGKQECGSEGSRVHTKLATAGLGRRLSAWVITIWGIMVDVLMREWVLAPNVGMGTGA